MRLPYLIFMLSQLAAGTLAIPSLYSIPAIKAECTMTVSTTSSGAPSTVSIKLTNKGDSAYRFLRTPTSLFSKVPEAQVFTVTKEGQPTTSPSFNGLMVSWDVEGAIRDSAFVTTLTKGSSTTLSFKVEGLFDFSTSGTGTYLLQPNPLFSLIDSAGKVRPARLSNPPVARFTIRSTHLVSEQRILSQNNFTLMADTCTVAQRNGIREATVKANTLVSKARTAVHVQQAEWARRPQEWFGPWNQARVRTVQIVYRNLARINFERYNYFCQCPGGDAYTYAYVYQMNYPNVALCPLWFATPPKQRFDSRAGTLIHEASHFLVNGGTDDHDYGVDICRDYAVNDPALAVDNADCYQYFAESVY